MATRYYDGSGVHIDSEGIRVGDDWYPLQALTYVWHRRTGRIRHGGYMLASRGGAVGLVVALIVMGALAARRVDLGSGSERTMLVAGGILAVIVLGGFAAFAIEWLLELVDRTHQFSHGRHEIWVRVDGADQMIYATSDLTRFGQVYRALQRAIENG
jgi:hypothetical protein